MKKKILFIFLAFTLLAFPLLTACEAEEDGDVNGNGNGDVTYPIQLTVANYFPAPAGQSTLLEEFCLELEERTDGRVQVDYFTGGTLLGPEAMVQGVIDGVADIGYSHVYYTAGRFPVTECLGLPLGYPSAWIGGHVMDDFYEEFKPAEWDDVVVLWLNASTPSGVSTADTPIRTLEDLAGLTIRAPGLAGEVIAALGATPVPTPMPEVYDAISRGEIDGESSNFETLFAFKFAEVCNYTTSLWQITFPYPFYCVMNQNSYDNLPDDIQAIFDTLVGEYKEGYNLVWNTADYLGRAAGEAEGVEFIYLSEAEAARWVAAVEPVIDDYIANMVAAGFSQTEVEGWIDFIQERIEFWTARQIAWHIVSAAGPPEVTD